MKKFKMTRMSGKGDEIVREWTETATADQLAEIEAEFNQKMKEGYFAANLDTNELTDKFDPQANTLLIPKIAGGWN